MAAIGSGRGTMDSQNQVQSDTEDRLKLLYPNVNEDETPLPRSWSTKDKFSYIGLSQNNLRVHYKEMKRLLTYFRNTDVSTFGPRVERTSGIRQTKKSADRLFCNDTRKIHNDHAE
ncbi:Ran-binding protein 10 [Papilio xuthus]|uniref:Ran-binding protein 10 n=1 Tax=Papilio xuthus TaxID=66420 RepID=A0A194PTP6_PAPXU|nr:Ran-binding protein 10 [Papilio xuthus]